ncbi:hypothetical protein [Streptomyces avicenniae]|uniref:hypothetical protein n=1 Tax=Streptomyces avicenniae TaxID=500153 RepID=UPI00069AA115|nr:hypothetical protein [Streptomyces avicenniae]
MPPTPRPAALVTLVTLAVLAPLPVATAAGPAVADDAAPEAFTLTDPRIVESSGLQASRQHPGVYWTHNDSDDAALLYAVDGATGDTVATVTLDGVEARDIEAVSLGPGDELFVADIGDNFDGGWSEVWIYRLPEPADLADATVTPTVSTLTYADGPRDAEALMVHPVTGRVYVASKKQDGGAKLYAGPEELSTSGVNVFEPVADLDLWVTDGAFSPDGTRLLLRGYFGAVMYRWHDDGAPEPLDQRVVPPLQQQGESVTFTPDGRTLMFGSEGEASAVEPVALGGALLPETVREQAAEGDAEGDGGTAAQDGAAGEGSGDDDGEIALSTRAAVVVAAAVLAVVLLRRLVTRRR